MVKVLGEEYLEKDPICRKYVKIALGKRDLVHELLKSHWGMVFFTGGAAAGACNLQNRGRPALPCLHGTGRQEPCVLYEKCQPGNRGPEAGRQQV